MTKKTGNEHFIFDGMPAGFLLNDFWSWQSSDLLSNTLRGVLAEFVVAKALGICTNSPRAEWEPYDLFYNERYRIEVKASSYVQSWNQSADSALRFSIRPARAWSAEEGYADEAAHQSDMYVFCVLSERDRGKVDPLILDQWEFYPVLTKELTEMCPSQKTAGISTILRLCPEPFDFSSLRDAVDWLFSGRTDIETRERIEAHNALNRAK